MTGRAVPPALAHLPAPALIEVFRALFMACAEEMGAALTRAAMSPNIKERRDFSCALFDGAGHLAAQAAHIPVHLGAAAQGVRHVIKRLRLAPGDIAITNDPYHGGTHLPDIMLVAPVYAGGGEPAFYAAVRAHHADVGGATAGSMAVARHIREEGVLIPPVRLFAGGEFRPGAVEALMRATRTPAEREGDLRAQAGACRVGIRRAEALCASYGTAFVVWMAKALRAHTRSVVRAALRAIPPGSYEAAGYLDDDGAGGGRLPIRVALTAGGPALIADFAGSAPPSAGPLNAAAAVAASATAYAVRCLLPPGTPENQGILDALKIRLPRRSLVNARYPAPVAAGSVETSQRMVDVLFAALGQALPDRIPAASQGTMNNLTAGGVDPRTGAPWTYYETLAGGAGGGPHGPGASGVHTHMTNTLNTPIEALEHAYPMRITEYRIRRESGGAGKHRGGDGLVRGYEFLAPAEIALLTERRESAPPGARGGEAGAAGANRYRVAQHDEVLVPAKCVLRAQVGDALTIATPGGGGWGEPESGGPGHGVR